MNIVPVAIKNTDEIIHLAAEYDYGLIYFLSEVKLLPIKEIGEDLLWEEMLEARFFSRNGELRFFMGEEGLAAVKVTEEGEERTSIDKEYILLNHRNWTNRFKKIKVRQYIDFDDDGQAHVALTRCLDLLGGE